MTAVPPPLPSFTWMSPSGTSGTLRCDPVKSASLIGRLGSSTFRLSTTPVSMSLTGSRFSSDSAPRPFHHGGSKVQSERNCHVADGFLHPSLSPPKGEADRGDQRRSSEQAGCGLNDCTSRAARRQGDRMKRRDF